MRTIKSSPKAMAPTRLPVVVVDFSADQAASIRIDGEPFEAIHPVERRTLDAVLRSITNDHGPVRVEVRETNEDVFTDIVVPHTPTATNTAVEIGQESSAEPGPSVPDTAFDTASSFVPNEELYVAVVVGDQRADAEGRARLRLPPAVQDSQHTVVLLGRRSGTFTVCDPS